MAVPYKFFYFISDNKILRIITCDITAPVSLLLQHCLSVDGSFMSLGQMVTLHELYFHTKVTLKHVASTVIIICLTCMNIKPVHFFYLVYQPVCRMSLQISDDMSVRSMK
jgi:hypothetical protein